MPLQTLQRFVGALTRPVRYRSETVLHTSVAVERISYTSQMRLDFALLLSEAKGELRF